MVVYLGLTSSQRSTIRFVLTINVSPRFSGLPCASADNATSHKLMHIHASHRHPPSVERDRQTDRARERSLSFLQYRALFSAPYPSTLPPLTPQRPTTTTNTTSTISALALIDIPASGLNSLLLVCVMTKHVVGIAQCNTGNQRDERQG